jgi:hypothetical protein
MKKKEIINIIMSAGNLPYKKAREIVTSILHDTVNNN